LEKELSKGHERKKDESKDGLRNVADKKFWRKKGYSKLTFASYIPSAPVLHLCTRYQAAERSMLGGIRQVIQV
jgi:hypothetical protein